MSGSMATKSYAIAQLADVVGGQVRGDGSATITGVANIEDARADQAVWVSRAQYASKLRASKAAVVLVPNNFGETPMPAILCGDIHESVARLLGAFAPPDHRPSPGVHATAVIDPTASLGDRVCIGPNVFVGPEARIGNGCTVHAGVFIGRGTVLGADCVLWANAVVRDGCRLGDRVTLHPCAVIGADGFGYYLKNGSLHKVPHTGGVVLEDDVEVGACACVDRSKFGDTIVGRGTKIDNLVQIAHNVRIGPNCVLAGQAGVAGSTKIGSGCSLGGMVGIIDNLVVGDGASIGAGSLVTRNIEAGQAVTGWPVQEVAKALRSQALIARLPELAAQIKELLARVERLESSTDHHPGR